MDLSTRQGRREQGQLIQRAVERAGLSVEELAGRIGCSRALIYQYLSGTTLAQPDRLQQIARECGVPLIFFYSEAEESAGAEPAAASSPAEPRVSTSEEVTSRVSDSLRALRELAEAQEGPPDYRALASTCERILSLAAQLGDRSAQSVAQLRLGNALLGISDYPRAADSLARAVSMALEVGLKDVEISARQSLGKVLVAMGRTTEAWDQFARIARGEEFAGRWQGTLSLGSIHEMRGEYQQAMERFDETVAILDEGEAAGLASAKTVAIGLLYVNANRVNVYLDGGDFAGARPIAERCLVDAEALGIAEQHLEAHLNLAWCDFYTGRWSSAYRSLTTMLQLARFLEDQNRETLARAWIGVFLAAAGDFDTAIAYGKDALAMALSRGDRRAELYAQLALADAYTGVFYRDSEARYHTNQALAVATSLRHERDEAECRLRLARLSAKTGDLNELQDAANRVLISAQRLGARHMECFARIMQCEALYQTLAAALSADLEAGKVTNDEEAASRHRELSEQIGAALVSAGDLDLSEARWRAAFLQARALQIAPAATPEAAEAPLRQALAILESMRAALRDAGLSDTLLEIEECAEVYANLARLLIATGRSEEASAFLDQTGWPPLTARLSDSSHATVERP